MKSFFTSLRNIFSPGTIGLSRHYSHPLDFPDTPPPVTIQFVFKPSVDDITKLWLLFQDDPKVAAFGQFTNGFAVSPWSKYNQTANWLVYSVKPKSWNDSAALKLLGHEVAHTLGGSHE